MGFTAMEITVPEMGLFVRKKSGRKGRSWNEEIPYLKMNMLITTTDTEHAAH